MSEQPPPQPARASQGRGQRFRLGAVLLLAVVAAVVAWLVLRDTSDSSTSQEASSVTVEQLENLAASVEHPVFWLGPRDGYTYELARDENGAIFVRYLPSGVEVGTKDPFVTVATYPFPGALAALQKVARENRSKVIRLAHSGIAVPSSRSPQSVHAAYPGVDYQVEVFDPTAGAALKAVTAGQLVAVGSLNASPGSAPETPKPTAASVARLKSVADSLGHPVYWAGPRAGSTYELTQNSTGAVYIRYLPAGVKVGAKDSYLTVATYPFPGSFGALQRLAEQQNEEPLELKGGGIALVDSTNPKSIHLAYPGSDYQIEVFDPSAARALQIVTSGRVSAVR